ncbi:MAG TPA: SDR family NAD(P)-dependent oxidoreductase [Nitrososphaerales archaeon]|nr:SDR family NAD(P)-dependent oxidoreductase [Nitrososphaerales archaeon]
MNSPQLEGKVAIITGAGSGIGRATSLLFAGEGANIVVADVSEEGGKKTSDLISRKFGSGRSAFVKTDVSNENDVKNMIGFAVDEFEKLDVIFNNAGIYEWTSVEITPTETWDHIIAVNLRGAFLGTKYSVPHLKKTSGVIVNTSSSLGVAGALESAAYAASKHGVIGLTKASALDLAQYKIRVNCICPGSIDTAMQAREFGRTKDPAKTREAYDKIYPMGRIGRPEEVAELVLFLATDRSSFITGTPFLIDGGLFAQWGESLASKIEV